MRVLRNLLLVLAAVATAALIPSTARASLVFVVNQDDATVSAIDTRSDTVVATIPVGFAPASIAAARDGKTLYVTHPERGFVSVIDADARKVARTLHVGGTPFGVAVGPQGRLFIGDWNADSVAAVDPLSGARLRKISVGHSPAGIATSPSGSLIFVANRRSDSVSVLNATTLSLVATLPVGKAPFALAVSPDATRVYVANVRSANVSVLSTITLRPVGLVPVGAMPYGVATSADGKRVFVANQSAGTVSVIDGANLEVMEAHKVGRFPEGLAAAPDADKVYAANWFSGDVSVLDSRSGEEIKRIKTGGGSRALIVVPAGAGDAPRQHGAGQLDARALRRLDGHLICLLGGGRPSGRSTWRGGICLLACALAMPLGATAEEQQACSEDEMLVFDASRSMDAAARILPGVARERRLGLVTYGPSPSVACSNVTLELPPAPDAAARIMERVNGLKPDGRTPLTRAVGVAADALRFRERPATIVLLTDGEETCKGDPCALARTLKAGGAGVTVHVISYHIEDSLGSEGIFQARCLADKTGGLYASAATAGEVADALKRALLCPLLSEARAAR